MGTCFGTQVKAESASINSGANDPGADPKKSSNSLLKETSSHGGMEVLVANNNDLSSTLAMGGDLLVFSYEDLKAATRNFHKDYLVGKGSSGYVFKGYIDEKTLMPTQPERGIVIAIKKLYLDGFQGHKEWLAKLHFLGTIHHPNIVKIFGFYAKDDHRLLVYEFMPRGSLANHLFKKGSHNGMLPWSIRMKITIDAARGLAFLHDGERPIIYKAFKTSNILLDLQFNGKLSAKDFGFAEEGVEGVYTGATGTYGYAAPEYVATGHLTAKSNVYSFGVVLLEILTGRRAVDRNRPDGEQNLVEWSRPYLSDRHRVSRIVDQKLEGQYSVEGAHKAARVARQCLRQDATVRPTMKQVVDSLEELLL